MKNNLMEDESMEKLGFNDQNSWENEEQEKQITFDRIKTFKDRAWERTHAKKQNSTEDSTKNNPV